MQDICIAQVVPGLGGIGGGGGVDGQASQAATGHQATSYGIPVIRAATGMTADFTVQLTRDVQGVYPINFDGVSNVCLLCLADGQTGKALFQVPCKMLQGGKISFTLTPQNVNYRPGLHFAQIHCYDANGDIKHTFKCCLQIQKTFIGSKFNGQYPLTIAEVRMELYDTSADQNVLLGDLQFSDVVIARCMDRAVQDWNQMPPTLATHQTVATFPFRANLCKGAAGYVLRMAAHRYNRNAMRHSNAGLSMDDHQKGQLYLQMAQQLLNQWQGWVAAKKSQLNMLQCMGSISDAFMQSTQTWIY